MYSCVTKTLFVKQEVKVFQANTKAVVVFQAVDGFHVKQPKTPDPLQ